MKSNFENDFKIPKPLANPHKIIVSTRKYYQAYYKKKWDSPDISLPRLNLNIYEGQLSRALTFMDMLIKALEKKDYEFKVERFENLVIVNNQKIKVSLREKSKIVRKDSKGWERTNEPTGILVLKVEAWTKKEWTDTNLTLEEKLREIIVGIELKAEDARQREIESNIRRLEYERKKAAKLAFEQQRKDDLLCFKDDLERAERWHKVNNLRTYMCEVTQRAKDNGSYTNELKTHLERLKKQIDWYDPFIDAKDELLDSIKKQTLELPKSEYNL